MIAYVLIANSRSELATVCGAFPSPEAAMNDAAHRCPQTLWWVRHPRDEYEAEHWIAEHGVCDQYEVHALSVTDYRCSTPGCESEMCQ